MAAVVKGELDEQKVRGRKTKFINCCNSSGKNAGAEMELWHWKRNTALWFPGARRKRTNKGRM